MRGGEQPEANVQPVGWRTRFGRVARRACRYVVKPAKTSSACWS